MSSGPSPRKRVLLVASSGNLLGGAEHCLVDVVSGMQGSDWEPIVAVPSEGTLAAALRRLGAIVWVVDLGVLRHRGEAKSPILALRMATAVAASRKLTKMIRQHDVRIVHSNAATVVAGALAARSARVPHVWHVRELLGGPAWKLLRRAMYAGSARIVCISDTVARHVTDGRASAVVTVIHDGIDLTLFHPAEHAEPGADV
ncbi:MAG TPA: glycosyltransferase, partial [Acidimicrobiia bacterium]|nr:glycosyltransferase [Acidimicrobiia bacterium]